MNNYEKLKKIIQEANPEIMDLKFGCEVIFTRGEEKRCVILEVEENHPFFFVGKLYCNNTDTYVGDFEKKEIKKLGRPIRLDDCMHAFKKMNVSKYRIAAEYLAMSWRLGYLDDQTDELKQWIFDNIR